LIEIDNKMMEIERIISLLHKSNHNNEVDIKSKENTIKEMKNKISFINCKNSFINSEKVEPFPGFFKKDESFVKSEIETRVKELEIKVSE